MPVDPNAWTDRWQRDTQQAKLAALLGEAAALDTERHRLACRYAGLLREIDQAAGNCNRWKPTPTRRP
jgi:hypothetical protein